MGKPKTGRRRGRPAAKGTLLADLLDAAGIGVGRLAAATGVCREQARRWRTGRTPVPAARRPVIAALLGLAPEQLDRWLAATTRTAATG